MNKYLKDIEFDIEYINLCINKVDNKLKGYINNKILPEYDLNNIKHNKDIIEISETNKIICLPDESFIKIKNNNTEIIGDYYMYDEDGNLHKKKEV